MKILIIILLASTLLVVVYFIWLSHLSEKSTEIGLSNNQLRPCPASPNCVCSEAGETATVQAIALVETDKKNTWQQLAPIITELGGEIQQQTDTYLWATFKTPLFRFVDDVEFRLDATQNLIHIRSASRVGHSDFGTNRKRVELLRSHLDQATPSSAAH